MSEMKQNFSDLSPEQIEQFFRMLERLAAQEQPQPQEKPTGEPVRERRVPVAARPMRPRPSEVHEATVRPQPQAQPQPRPSLVPQELQLFAILLGLAIIFYTIAAAILLPKWMGLPGYLSGMGIVIGLAVYAKARQMLRRKGNVR